MDAAACKSCSTYKGAARLRLWQRSNNRGKSAAAAREGSLHVHESGDMAFRQQLAVFLAIGTASRRRTSSSIAKLLDVGWSTTPQARHDADLQLEEVRRIAGSDVRATKLRGSC